MSTKKEYLGEGLGTFILVLFGCGSVAAAVLFQAFGSLLEVALLWGIGVAIAIFTVRNSCPAHLNPAVTVAMWLSDKVEGKKVIGYIVSQLIGAFLAGGLLFLTFEESIILFEQTNNIVRGTTDSIRSAQFFGEYYPNPGFAGKIVVSTGLACLMEALGTFILVLVIFRLTQKKEQSDNIVPIMIGLTVTAIICLVAPFTQAGLNPARDFGPRIIAYIAGWGNAAFPIVPWSFITVYILSPIVGGSIASCVNKLIGQKN